MALPVVGVRVLRLIGTGILDEDGVLDLPAIGVLSADELDGVLPFPPLVTGVDVFLGVEDPKPTGVCL